MTGDYIAFDTLGEPTRARDLPRYLPRRLGDVLAAALSREPHGGADAAVPAALADGPVPDHLADAAVEHRVAIPYPGRDDLDDVAHV